MFVKLIASGDLSVITWVIMSRPGCFLRDQIRGACLRKFFQNIAMGGTCVALGAFGAAILKGSGAAAAGLVAMMSVYFFVMAGLALAQRANPETYKSFKELLAQFQVSLDELSTLVEEERAALPANAAKSLVVLPSWIWDPSGPLLIPLHEIAWIYPKNTTTYRNGVKQGTTHELMVHPLYAPHAGLSVAAGPGGSEAIMNAVTKHAPWAIVGYQAGLQALSGGLSDTVRTRRDAMRANQ